MTEQLRPSGVAIRTLRDVTVLDTGGPRLIVVACDAVGGIGPKEADTVATDATTTAHFAVRVPLLEVLCAGATPVLAVDNLCVEPEPTGREMTREIERVLRPLSVELTGSTEKNVPTRATAVGITVLGVAVPGQIRIGTAIDGDRVVCLGLPLSAPDNEVVIGHPDIIDLESVIQALAVPGVHDVVPVGSRGVAHEARAVADAAGLEFRPAEATSVHLERSAGPATCVVATCDEQAAHALAALRPGLPVQVVGALAAAS